jgi:antitoxin MazE
LKTRLVQIGNSRGIRLPKTLLAEAQLADQIELRAEPGCIFIRSAKPPRFGWADAARRMREFDEDRLMDATPSSKFDREEWKWQ